MDNDKKYEAAKKRVEAKFGFFIHLAVYVLVNGLLITINLIRSNEVLWFVWPLAGWGIGLLFHGLSVFVFSSFKTIKEGMIQKELNKRSN